MEKICSVCKKTPIEKAKSAKGQRILTCKCGCWVNKDNDFVFEDSYTAKPTLRFLVIRN